MSAFLAAVHFVGASSAAFYEAHRVTDLPIRAPSYAGLLPVDKDGAQLFYWLFLPQDADYRSAPLILWLNGGPGLSSMFGLFNENGPLEVDSRTLELRARQIHWNTRFSMIFVTVPLF